MKCSWDMSLRFSVLLLAFGLVACSPIGPRTIPRDQFDYNASIADSSQQQLLTNLVRLRYAETPTFLRVSSVISQYTRISSVNAGVDANAGISGDDTATLGGSLIWIDKPTITYTPLSGQEFSNNLLTPLPPSELFLLMQAGWPAELVLRMTTWSINDIDNDITRPSRRREADPELFELFDIWRQLRDAGLLGIRKAKATTDGGDGDVKLRLRKVPAAEGYRREIERFRELLGMEQSLSEFRLTYGLVPEEPTDIAVLTGSVWDIMLSLAWQFDVPAEHVESGRTGATFKSSQQGRVAPIQVSFSKDVPEDAFVAIRQHDYWFYIDQHDRQSKRAFSFLQLLLNLAETGSTAKGPLITISN